MDGSIITFYSFKGGVGRSFTLANVAYVLASWGFKVLCVDWDLEAPGLNFYFRSGPAKSHSGVFGLIDSMRDSSTLDETASRPFELRVDLKEAEVGSRLRLIPAGRQAHGEAPLNWDDLYENHNFADKIERLKESWKSRYDFILIDSRTGVTDIGSICTAHLPDAVAFVTTPNDQCVDGTRMVADRARSARSRLKYSSGRAQFFPIVSRFDGREEYSEARIWRRRLAKRLGGLMEDWLPARIDPASLIEKLTVPYVTKWSFGERLPVSYNEPALDPEFVTYSFETISAVIASRFRAVLRLLDDRDGVVADCKAMAKLRGGFQYDAFLSYPLNRAEEAKRLSSKLDTMGLNCHTISAEKLSEFGQSYSDALTHSVESCRHLLILVDSELNPQQDYEFYSFSRRTLDLHTRRIIVPIILDTANRHGNVPMRLLRMKPLRWDGKSCEAVANRVYKLLSSIPQD